MQHFAAGCVLTSLLLVAGHWFPWPTGALHRLGAYSYGVSAILAGAFVWMPRATWFSLVVLCIVAGAVTGLTYLYDAAANGHFNDRG